MTRSTLASRTRRSVRNTLMTAGVAATLLTALPVASAQAATPKVMIMSGAFSGYALCASPTDDWVWLKKVDAANPDAFCLWKVIGASSQFTLYNPAKDEVMAYTGGNEGVVVMEDSGTSRLGANGELWSWGGQEGWGRRLCSPSGTAGRTSTPRTVSTTPVPTRCTPAVGVMVPSVS